MPIEPVLINKVPAVRDTQRQRLYNAEDAWRRTWPSFTLRSVEHVRAYHSIANDELGVPATVDVAIAPPGEYAFARIVGPPSITYPTSAWALNKAVVVHEMNHFLVNRGFPHHGREFASEMLNSVRLMLGDEARESLQTFYNTRGVVYGYDDAHYAKIVADFKWRIRRPGVQSNGNKAYDCIIIILKTGRRYIMRVTNGPGGVSWPDTEMENMTELISKHKVAYLA